MLISANLSSVDFFWILSTECFLIEDFLLDWSVDALVFVFALAARNFGISGGIFVSGSGTSISEGRSSSLVSRFDLASKIIL